MRVSLTWVATPLIAVLINCVQTTGKTNPNEDIVADIATDSGHDDASVGDITTDVEDIVEDITEDTAPPVD